MGNEILICEHTNGYKVPYISTMCFHGAELWCPYCGDSIGMFGGGTDVKITETLIGRLTIYEEHSKYYLCTMGFFACVGTTFENKKTDREDFPSNIIKEMEEFREKYNWKHKIKARSLIGKDIIEALEFKCVDCEKFMMEGCCPQWRKDREKGCEGPCKDWKRRKE